MALSQQQLADLTARIARRREELEAQTHQDADEAREAQFSTFAGEAPDPGDASTADLLSDLADAEVGRDLRELRQLQAAQERIDAGNYGQCIDCGRDIPFERLDAAPAALRCIECQIAYEHKFAQPPRSSL